MKTYTVIKFQCGTLKKLSQTTVTAENLESARRLGEKDLNVQPNEFVGAEAL
jgi:hypothetical protein